MLMVLHATAVYIKTFFLLILLLFFPSEYTHTEAVMLFYVYYLEIHL